METNFRFALSEMCVCACACIGRAAGLIGRTDNAFQQSYVMQDTGKEQDSNVIYLVSEK